MKLVRLTPEHIREIYTWLDIDDISEFLWPSSIKPTFEEFCSGMAIFDGVINAVYPVECPSGKLAGFFIVELATGHKRAQFHTTWHPDYRGRALIRGFAALVEFLKTELNIKNIHTMPPVENDKANAILPRLGFEFLGVIPEYYQLERGLVDVNHWILR